MADVFLICVIVIAFFILLVVGLYFLVKFQHPDDKNDAYVPKLVVWLGFVFSGATVLLLPLDVANNEGYAGECGLGSASVGSFLYVRANSSPSPHPTPRTETLIQSMYNQRMRWVQHSFLRGT